MIIPNPPSDTTPGYPLHYGSEHVKVKTERGKEIEVLRAENRALHERLSERESGR